MALATMLVAVLASGIAAAVLRSPAATRSTSSTAPAGSPARPQQRSAPQQPAVAQAKPVVPAKPVRVKPARTKPGGAKPGRVAHPASPSGANPSGAGALPFTGPAPVAPAVGLAVLLMATGAWALRAPRPVRSVVGGTAIDRLRTGSRYQPSL
jgi:hypothetical protein